MKSLMTGFSGTPPKGKDVRDTKMLDTTAREKNATGTNSQKAHTVKHKPFGEAGARGRS